MLFRIKKNKTDHPGLLRRGGRGDVFPQQLARGNEKTPNF